MSFNISRIDSLEELGKLEHKWGQARRASQDDDLFLTFWWAQEWLRIYGSDLEPWVLVAGDDQGTRGILPLVLQRHSVGVRRLVFLGSGNVMPSHLDIIGAPELRAELAREFWNYLDERRSEWDLIDLKGVADTSPLLDLAEYATGDTGSGIIRAPMAQSPFAILPDSFDEYLKARGSKTRSQVRYEQRRLARDYPAARWACVATAGELDTVFDALVRLHQARWSRRGEAGSYAQPRFAEFHRAAAHAGLAHGALRLYYLEIQNEIVAAFYCYQVGSRVFYYSSGFDETWAKYSVGTLLLAYALEQSIAAGAREFDFLQGDEGYKTHWATGVREDCRLRAISPHWRGQLAWARTQSAENLRGLARKALPRDVRRSIKQAMRRL